jgi:hypothetical protein
VAAGLRGAERSRHLLRLNRTSVGGVPVTCAPCRPAAWSAKLPLLGAFEVGATLDAAPRTMDRLLSEPA